MISGPKFIKLFSPNVGKITVQNVLVRFQISSSILEIFAAKFWSRPKLDQVLHVFPINFCFFWEGAPKFWTAL